MVQKKFLFHTIQNATEQASQPRVWEQGSGNQERQGPSPNSPKLPTSVYLSQGVHTNWIPG